MTEEPRLLSDKEIDDLIEQQRVDGYLMHFDVHNPSPLEPEPTTGPPGKTPGCWLGGAPTLAAEIPWPSFYSTTQEINVPMIFLGQVDCAQIPENADRPEIPRSGTLFFFYDPIFDFEHEGEGKVIYVDEEVSTAPERETPPLSAVDYDKIRYGDYTIVEVDHLR